MNVSFAQLSAAAIDAYDSARQARVSQPNSSSSGNDPIKEVSKPQNSPSVPTFEPDEVKVQWDTSDHSRIYQFVNQQSGALVLQVPSDEVLDVAHGIQQELQQEVSQQRTAAAGTEGEKSNGD